MHLLFPFSNDGKCAPIDSQLKILLYLLLFMYGSFTFLFSFISITSPSYILLLSLLYSFMCLKIRLLRLYISYLLCLRTSDRRYFNTSVSHTPQQMQETTSSMWSCSVSVALCITGTSTHLLLLEVPITLCM